MVAINNIHIGTKESITGIKEPTHGNQRTYARVSDLQVHAYVERYTKYDIERHYVNFLE